MAVRVACQDGIERRHPRVEIHVQLLPERVVRAKRRLSDLGKDRRTRAADDMRQGGPSDDLPARRRTAPSHLPLAYVFDMVGACPGADHVVADDRPNTGRRISGSVGLDGGDEELGDRHATQILEQALQLRAKRASVKREVARKIFRSRHIDWCLTRRRLFRRKQSCAPEAWIEECGRDGGGRRRPRAKRVGQFTEPRLEFLDLGFQEKAVVPRVEVFQKWLEGFRDRKRDGRPGLWTGRLRSEVHEDARGRHARDEERGALPTSHARGSHPASLWTTIDAGPQDQAAGRAKAYTSVAPTTVLHADDRGRRLSAAGQRQSKDATASADRLSPCSSLR